MESKALKEEKKITAKKAIVTSFVVDLLDVVLNLGIALISGSVIMITQVFEAVSDLMASGFLLVGLRRSVRRDDRTHPFGYGREIYFWTLMSALIMFGLTSSVSFYFGWQRFLHPEQIHDINIAVFVLILTFFTNLYAFILSLRRLLRSRHLKHIVRIFYRSSLVETKTTFILDLMGTLASLFGAIALAIYLLTGDSRYDGLGAMIIGVMLAFFSVLLILGIRDLLVGKSASEATEKRIEKSALRIREVESVLDMKTLQIGPERLMVNLDVHMNSNLSTRQLEVLIDEIKESIRKEVPSVKYLQVELETPNS